MVGVPVNKPLRFVATYWTKKENAHPVELTSQLRRHPLGLVHALYATMSGLQFEGCCSLPAAACSTRVSRDGRDETQMSSESEAVPYACVCRTGAGLALLSVVSC
jgi:hypothetical protein